jgi:hypothetical protein
MASPTDRLPDYDVPFFSGRSVALSENVDRISKICQFIIIAAMQQ